MECRDSQQLVHHLQKPCLLSRHHLLLNSPHGALALFLAALNPSVPAQAQAQARTLAQAQAHAQVQAHPQALPLVLPHKHLKAKAKLSI